MVQIDRLHPELIFERGRLGAATWISRLHVVWTADVGWLGGQHLQKVDHIGSSSLKIHVKRTRVCLKMRCNVPWNYLFE